MDFDSSPQFYQQRAITQTPADAAKDAALQESVVTGLSQPLAAGLTAAARQAKWERERKFRTIWDAVEWLQKHHPEIDLDAPYKPRENR